jgi:RNA polymerase sigma-70 factor (ECF subfamily)
VKGTAEREDAVQDILLKSFESIGRYNPEYAFSTWLYTLANRYCTDVFRKFRFRKTLCFSDSGFEQSLDPPDSRRPGPEQEHEANRRKAEIARAIGQLSPADRQLVVLRYFEELKISDIGKIMGYPEGTVKFRIYEIKKVLRGVLGEVHENE